MEEQGNSKKISVYIFSCNRGIFLQNCVKSVKKCIPGAPITIFDDNSYDIKTLQILDKIKRDAEIIKPNRKNKKHYYSGRLHNNKNLAISDAKRKNIKRFLFLHDDMQIVRPLTSNDFQYINEFFALSKKSFELHVCFLKNQNRSWDEKHMEIDKSKRAYIRRKQRNSNNPQAFSDTGIFDLGRFETLFGAFEIGELENGRKAEKKGIIMGFFAYPFAAWLPFSITYRNKKRPLTRRLIEKINGAGFHPINFMSKRRIRYLFDRGLSELPFAESFLSSPSAPKIKKCWFVMGAEEYALARGGWHYKLMILFNPIKHRKDIARLFLKLWKK